LQCLSVQRSSRRCVGWQKVLRTPNQSERVMDRFALEHNLRDAYARLLACQQDLLSQRAQVRELEQCGLDASVARALLHIYEESQEMAVFNRDCLSNALRRADFAAADPSIDDQETFVDAEFHHRLAA
jgi:hypothetical protein